MVYQTLTELRIPYITCGHANSAGMDVSVTKANILEQGEMIEELGPKITFRTQPHGSCKFLFTDWLSTAEEITP